MLIVSLVPEIALGIGAVYGALCFSLSGFSFPIEAMPRVFTGISWLYPIRHYYLNYCDIAIFGNGLEHTWPHFVALLAFGLAGLAGVWAGRHYTEDPVEDEGFKSMQPPTGSIKSRLSILVDIWDVFTAEIRRVFSNKMVMLAFFFLCDRERLLLLLELLLPQAWRSTVVHMGNAVCRDLRLYLRGQLLIAGAVSLLSVATLTLVGVGNALALGLIIGLLNMIPYFGPFIGGVPAVLIALGDSWQRAALTVAALSVVQQLDGSWISPRIMGSLTGLSPGAVLVGIYAGARLGGVAGMLFALPVMMSLRTVFRIFVQKCENI